MAYMKENGFTVLGKNPESPEAQAAMGQVPVGLEGCHTAIVDGYIISGHVPAREINRLLAERPDIAGLAVPGMPVGSPGMEIPGESAQPYDVIAFDASGSTEVYASYR